MFNKLILFICISLMGIFPASAGVYEDILAAANNGRTEEVIGLLHRGLDVNTTDRDGFTLLAIAARTGNLPLAEFLLSNRGSLERRNRHGDTPLLLAVIQNHKGMVNFLLKAGAEINPRGWTPLHYAIYGNTLDLAQLLIGQGATLDLRAPNGRTALMLAAQLGHLDAVVLLVSSGANIALKDFDGRSAEDIAGASGFPDIVEFLQGKK